MDFHQTNDDKAYCIKVHGDYDTHNLLNTDEETVVIEEAVGDYLELLLRNRGLLVIGSAGFEKSIHTLFDRLTSKNSASKRILHYGLYNFRARFCEEELIPALVQRQRHDLLNR